MSAVLHWPSLSGGVSLLRLSVLLSSLSSSHPSPSSHASSHHAPPLPPTFPLTTLSPPPLPLLLGVPAPARVGRCSGAFLKVHFPNLFCAGGPVSWAFHCHSDCTLVWMDPQPVQVFPSIFTIHKVDGFTPVLKVRTL